MKKIFKYFHNDYWILKKHKKTQLAIFDLWNKKYKKFSEANLKKESELLKQEYQKHQNLEKILVPAYALACEVIFRLKKITLHPVQVLASIVLHFGDVAELKTGEGKTLASVLPAYLNSFKGKSVYIITVNEYLVSRDFEDNGAIFNFLNVSVGKTLNKMARAEKIKNYAADIVYGTNAEFGFDYLRDNMLNIYEAKLQKNHYYVIIDEVDSVLVDEGRTPLIISGKPKNRSEWYKKVDNFVKKLKKTDFTIDSESKSCFLNPSGITKTNSFFKINNIFDINNSLLFHSITNSLRANFILKNNIDYLVRDKKIMLIDQFTGRVMADRMLSEGLHQAVEAKENCNIQNETNILATITYQNFFRIFDKIAGMTGTAKSEEEELINLFNMHVLQIPTNKPVIRKDDSDFFFLSNQAKYNALIKKIQILNAKKQPILIGTCSVQISEEIGKILKRMGFKFNILNAKRFEAEAKIIAKAGIAGTITIATNMAGRGTDIKLDDVARKSGGLAILGIERNESRRVDWQLQGRSGRQGDPGYSAFYVSLEDNLFLRFGSKVFRKVFKGIENQALSSKFLDRTILKFQKKIQNLNYEQRKSMLEYDNVISQQRQIIYGQRDFLASANYLDLKKYLFKLTEKFLFIKWNEFFKNKWEITPEEYVFFLEYVRRSSELEFTKFKINPSMNHTRLEVINNFLEYIWNYYDKIQRRESYFTHLHSKMSLVKTIDSFWTDHLDELFRLKNSTFLHSYAQKKPLQVFIEKGNDLFGVLKTNIIFYGTPELFRSWKRIENLLAKVDERKAKELEAKLKTNPLPTENNLEKNQ